MKKKNLKAFTLAEVLITLSIVGILAAITIPTLIAHNRKMVIKNRFKKAYSVLTTQFELAKKDYDAQPLCYYYYINNKISSKGTECWDFVINYFFKKLNYSSYCANKSYEKGCVPNYKAKDFNSNVSGCGGFSAERIKNTNPSVVLQNGMIVFTYGAYENMPYIGIDINGKEGPNQGGIDVYSLILFKDGDTVELTAYNNSVIGCLKPANNSVFTTFTDIMK